MEALGILEISNLRTLSRMARIIDWRYINAVILDLIATERENTAIDSFVVKTCKQSTAIRRRIHGGYKDQGSLPSYYRIRAHSKTSANAVIQIVFLVCLNSEQVLHIVAYCNGLNPGYLLFIYIARYADAQVTHTYNRDFAVLPHLLFPKFLAFRSRFMLIVHFRAHLSIWIFTLTVL